MKILVALKPVPDPEQKFRLRDGILDFTQVGIITNPFDEYALEAALRLTDRFVQDKPVRGDDIIVAVSIGETRACTKVLKRALGLGVNKVYHVLANEDQLDFTVVAKVLETIALRETPDLILLGKQTVDGDAGLVPPYLAGLLDIPQAIGAAAITHTGPTIITEREIDGGIEIKELSLPALVSVDLRIVAPDSVKPQHCTTEYSWADGPRYPNIRGMLKTKKMVIPALPLEEFSQSLSLAVTERDPALPPARPPGTMVETPEAMIHLVSSYLQKGELHE